MTGGIVASIKTIKLHNRETVIPLKDIGTLLETAKEIKLK